MRKKKKIKKTLSNLKKRKRIFIKFAIPGDKGKETLIEARHLQRGIDFLYRGHKPGSAAWKATTENIKRMLRYNVINWHGIILFCESLRISPATVYSLLAKHFSQEKISKEKVGFLNAVLVKSLLNKIDKWGGVPKAWKNHKAYINSWCRKTNTPIFNSLSHFQDLVSEWKNLTVGKRKKKIVPYFKDKEFKI